MEDIIAAIAITCLLLILACFIIVMVWSVFTASYFKYKLYRKENKLQWRCEETWKSREDRLNNKRIDFECTLSYRILPSEVNKFVRVFGDNDWKYPFEEFLTFSNQDEFKKYVSNFITYNDIKTWTDEKNGILWYEP